MYQVYIDLCKACRLVEVTEPPKRIVVVTAVCQRKERNKLADPPKRKNNSTALY